ncbi:hypothetical protein K1719_000114 [Acacia pycnantha]|nr:hypothetical protein K1719_000114 [Acacia pycnantha]
MILQKANVSVLNFLMCKYIEKIPNLSGLPSLKELQLSFCKNLIEIDNSVGQLPKLETLDVSGCTQLRTFPSELNTPSLVHLGHRNCWNLNFFPKIVTRVMKIFVLDLSGFKNIKKMPNLSGLASLKRLDLRECKNLIEIDNSVGQLPKLETLDVSGCSQLRTFPSELNTPSLVHLGLSYCRNLNSFPEIATREMKISSLLLEETGIDQLPSSIENLTKLGWVDIRMNSRVRSIKLPRSTFLLPKLKDIRVEGFKEELIIEVESTRYSKIWSLEIRFCNISNENLRICLAAFSNVCQLDLTGSNFTILPACIEDCRFLYGLVLDKCKHLIEVEKELLASVVPINIQYVLGQAHFCVPEGSIPEWFDHCSKGPSISFWFLDQYFPTYLIICAIVEAKGDYVKVKREVLINEEACIDLITSVSIGYDEDHIIVDYIWTIDMDKSFAQGQWKHAKICLFPFRGATVKESKIYVVRDDITNMENIRFTDPFQCSDLLTNDQGCTMEGDTTTTNNPIFPSQSERQHTHSHVVLDIDSLRRLSAACRILTFPVSIHMDHGIVGSKVEYDIIITKPDVMEFLSMQELCITIIQLFVMFADNLCYDREIDDRFGFLCPNATQSVGNTREDRVSYIGSTIKEGNKQCWLAPIHEGEQSDDIEKIFTEALEMYHIIGEKNTKWLRPSYRRQLGDKECGYYVMGYMYDIIKLNQVHLLDTHFKNLECYTQEDINFIRNVWSDYFLELMPNWYYAGDCSMHISGVTLVCFSKHDTVSVGLK